MNKQEAIEAIKEISDDLQEVRFVSLESVINIVSQIDEPQKPVIPKFVAEWIEKYKKQGKTLYMAMDAIHYSSHPCRDWFEVNQDTFARAWLDGYEVEKEKKYRVMLSNKQVLSKDDEFNTVFFVHDTTDLRAEFTRPELEQAGFGWVFDCEGAEVEEVE